MSNESVSTLRCLICYIIYVSEQGSALEFLQKMTLFFLPHPPSFPVSLLFQGSFECGSCDEGYVELGSFDCIFSDPCVANQHDCEREEYCINHAVGEYYCECPIGMIGNGRQCASDHDLDGIPNSQLTVGCDSPPCSVVSHMTSTTASHDTTLESCRVLALHISTIDQV